MADYIYLLETRLTPAQKEALLMVREIARAKGITVFLVGGAVRDLTSGSSVRDLDVVVQGNALKLKKELEKAGAHIHGEHEPSQVVFVRSKYGARLEVGSTLSVAYPKPAKPVYKAATILEDLRRRDFTANAMAISLNDGSYGLLMDPLNGVADIEQRQLRLVSPYGFIDDPSRLIRAARLQNRLGWQMEERTHQRYNNAKEEDAIKALPAWHRGYELEEIVFEEDGLRTLKALEHEGWMKHLMPAWTGSKANASALNDLAEKNGLLQMQGIRADASAAAFPLLTAKLAPKDVKDLKKHFARPGFVKEIETLEKEVKEFSTQFMSKAAAAPSDAWKMLHAAKPESVLGLAFSGKGAAIQNKFKAFFTEWPLAKTRIPYTMMQEMRIQPEVARYDELMDKLFFALMDGKLTTPEETKAFLEPYSPPAPPPTIHLRRPRAAKKEAKVPKARIKKADKLAAAAAAEGAAVVDAVVEVVKGAKNKVAAAEVTSKIAGAAAAVVAAAKALVAPAGKKTAPVKAAAKKAVAAKKVAAKKSAPAKKAAPKKAVAKKVAPKKAAKKAAPVKKAAKKVVAKKPVAKKAAPKKVAAKKPVKKAAKPVAKKKR